MSQTPQYQISSSEDEDEMPPQKKVKVRLTNSSVHEQFDQSEAKGVILSNCKHCNTSLKGTNPTNLKRHLEAKHPAVLAVVKKADAEAKAAQEYESPKEPKCKAASKLTSVKSKLFGCLDKYISKQSDKTPLAKNRQEKS